MWLIPVSDVPKHLWQRSIILDEVITENSYCSFHLSSKINSHKVTESLLNCKPAYSEVFKNRLCHWWCCDFYRQMYVFLQRFACSSPTSTRMNANSWAGELYRQHSLLVCVCVRMCVRLRRSCNQSSLSGQSLCRAHCCPLFLRCWPLFNFLPSTLLLFSLTTCPVDFFPPSFGKTFAELCCRDLPAATAREGESRRKKEKKTEKLRQTNRSLLYRGERHWERTCSSSVFPFSLLAFV